jgi:hypothetical protein
MLVGPGTVFILDSGEGAVEDRLLFLDAGVIDQLARATGRRRDCTRASVCLTLSIHMSPPLTPGYSYCGESILMPSFVTAFMVRSSEHARSGPLIQPIYLDQRRASTDRPIRAYPRPWLPWTPLEVDQIFVEPRAETPADAVKCAGRL